MRPLRSCSTSNSSWMTFQSGGLWDTSRRAASCLTATRSAFLCHWRFALYLGVRLSLKVVWNLFHNWNTADVLLFITLTSFFHLHLLQQVGLWTHLDFNIEYNGESVIFANVSVKDVKPVPLEEGAGGGGLTITHTYSVRWFESSLPHSRRGERLRDYSFFPKTLEIHWLSIINSLVLVVLLLGFVIIILMRVLKNDFARLVGAKAQRFLAKT